MIYYNLFRFEIKFGEILTYPIHVITRNKKIRTLYEKRGISDPSILVKKTLNNPDGFRSVIAGGHFYILISLLFFGILNLVLFIFNRKFTLEKEHFISLFVASIILAYFLIDYKNKSCYYFKEFDSMTSNQRKKWSWISFFIVIAIWIFGFGMFIFRYC